MAKLDFDIAAKLKLKASEVPENANAAERFFIRTRYIRAAAALLIVILTAVLPLRSLTGDIFAANRLKIAINVFACVVAGIDVLLCAVDCVFKHRKICDSVLMALAAVLAALCGHAAAAAVALAIYHFSRLLLDCAAYSANTDAYRFMDFCPSVAKVMVNDIFAETPTQSVQPGAALVVEPGERIPLDGIVRSGNSSVDESELLGRGERSVVIGDEVYSGGRNVTSQLIIEVTRNAEDSTAQRIISMIDRSLDEKSASQQRLEKFFEKFVPAVLAIGLVAAVVVGIVAKLPIAECISRFSMFAVIACTGTVLLAIPAAYYTHLCRSSGNGVIIRNADAFENLRTTRHVFFNKTGTLTDGKYRLVGVAAHKVSREELLRLVAYVEQGVKHPIADAVTKAVGTVDTFGGMDNRTEVPGAGIYAVIKGNDVHIGSKRLMDSIDCQVKSYDNCEFYVAINRQYAGTIVLEESIRESVYGVASEMHDAGITEVGIMSSCGENETKHVADALGFDKAFSGLRSDEKMAELEHIKSESGEKIAFIGYGANDSAAIAYADTGILVCSGISDITVKSPDVMLLNGDLHSVMALTASGSTLRNACLRALTLSAIIKLILMILAVVGFAGIWFYVLLDALAGACAVAVALHTIRKDIF